jgi:hypothetical protein
MTSQITTYSGNIDVSFPVAGKDNDTSGFRNNFAHIQDALTEAATEIGQLQNNAVLIGSLDSPSTTVVNNMGGSTIENGIHNRFYAQAYISPVIGTSTNVDLHNGDLQVFPVNAGVTLNFINWPESGQYAKVRLVLSSSDGSDHTIAFSTTGGTIKYGNTGTSLIGFPTPFTVPTKVTSFTYGSNASGQTILALTSVLNIQPGNTVTGTFGIAEGTTVDAVDLSTSTVLLSDNIVTTVKGTISASGDGSHATLTFVNATGVQPFNIGDTVTVSGINNTSGYNGTHTLTDATISTIKFASTTTESQTVAGNITLSGVTQGSPITFAYSGPRVVEAWTYNGGATVYMSVSENY